MSRYFSFEAVAAACRVLRDAGISSTHLSALRYCFALDAFAEKYGRDCSLKKGSTDKDLFIELVGDVASIDVDPNAASPSYIDNFEGSKPKKDKLASQISSNFFTANAVRQSRGKSSELYPSGKDKYLFNVSDEVLEISSLKYEHIARYLPAAETRIAFAVWAARFDEIPDEPSKTIALNSALRRRYSKKLVDALLAGAETAFTCLGLSDEDMFDDSKPLLTWKFLFPSKVNKHAANPITEPRNWIFFGAPGTGKSYQLNQLAKESFAKKNVTRVTFYPDYTYSQFVGCYKPCTNENGDIAYDYVAGPFLDTYLNACTHPYDQYLLIIEEINRANPAAVFGDVFQLLDRNAGGWSEYSVAVPDDMKKHIAKRLGTLNEEEQSSIEAYYDPDMDFGEFSCSAKSDLALPPNMFIWATMNSADQGVYPMDTAFKRRWDFRYIGIDDGEDAEVSIADEKRRLSNVSVSWGKEGTHKANWNALRKAINGFLSNDVKLNEDKLLGPFFVSPSSLTDKRFGAAFKDKVLLYLYEDACKTKHSKVFAGDLNTYSAVCEAFDERGTGIFVDGFKSHYKEGVSVASEDNASPEE